MCIFILILYRVATSYNKIAIINILNKQPKKFVHPTLLQACGKKVPQIVSRIVKEKKEVPRRRIVKKNKIKNNYRV